MLAIMVIYAHKWHMYFCKHQEAIITIRLLAIATIITIVMITQIFGHCKFYSLAQLVPIFRVENFVLHVYTELGFLAVVWKWVHV